MKILVLALLGGCISCCTYGQDSLDVTNGEEVFERLAITYPDSVRHKDQGKVMAYYTFDQRLPAIEKYYRNGRQNGVYKSFYPDGGLMEFGVYGNGIRHGEWTHYDKDGSIVIKGKYKDGKKHGYWAYRKQECYGRYRNGQKNGKWVCYEGYNEVKTFYKDGVKLEEKPGLMERIVP